MSFKGWRDMPIGGMILEAGNSVEYHTGDWRAFRPVRGEAALHPLLPVLAVLPRLQHPGGCRKRKDGRV